jgi:hypothetical protein
VSGFTRRSPYTLTAAPIESSSSPRQFCGAVAAGADIETYLTWPPSLVIGGEEHAVDQEDCRCRRRNPTPADLALSDGNCSYNTGVYACTCWVAIPPD